MILSISLALLVAGTLLVALNKTEIPEIPIYLASGVILSILTSLFTSLNVFSHSFVEKEIMRELALLGLTILIFYRTSGFLIDPNRKTAVDSFKASIFTSSVLFSGVAGVFLYLDFPVYESLIFGVTSAIGSTLLDSGLVREEARKSHIYGWLTEDMNFFEDVLGLAVFTLIISVFTEISTFVALTACLAVIVTSLILRNGFSDVILSITGGENELVLLSGIATLISLISITESAGITELTGVYAAGLLVANTELGFRVRERFTSVKDFFTALSFIAIGYILSVPSLPYILAAVLLFVSVMVFRTAFITQVLRIQGYDLRSSFMAGLQSSQISEIVVVGALLLMPVTSGELLTAVVLSFTGSILSANLLQRNENRVFDGLFSNYELDSEKSDLPRDLTDHVILAGYDWKTEALDEITDRKVVAVDYSIENIERAEEEGVSHLLADLYSDQAWEEVNVSEASVIVSAIRDRDLLEKIEDMDVDAEKILVKEKSEEIKKEIRKMLRKALR
jgi:Kef-type K+ transport system membrane component KefB